MKLNLTIREEVDYSIVLSSLLLVTLIVYLLSVKIDSFKVLSCIIESRHEVIEDAA